MNPTEVKNKRVLFSPLNWGYGHVARSIPLLKQLESNGCAVLIACEEDQKDIYKEYLPESVTYLRHEGYPFNFGGKGNFNWDLLKAYPNLRTRMSSERDQVKDYIDQFDIDIVMSDHRYGFFSDSCYSIFITHQLNLPTRRHEGWVDRYHKRLINKFDEVWVMDYPDSRLAGKLSQNTDGHHVTYIGPWSRFSVNEGHENSEGKIVLIVSGPNVYGQQLIDHYLDQYTPEELLIIASKELNVKADYRSSAKTWKEKDKEILSAKKVISRSGYSTIMDFEYLDCELELLPTPGQREQEYLYQLHCKNRLPT